MPGALGRLHRYEEALASLDRALELNVQNANASVMHATSLVFLERYEQALVSAGKALAVDPKHARMLWLRGILLVSCGRLEEALVSFDKYLALEPQDTEAHALGSLGLAKRHCPHKARDSMQQLLSGEIPLDLKSSVVDATRYFGP